MKIRVFFYPYALAIYLSLLHIIPMKTYIKILALILVLPTLWGCPFVFLGAAATTGVVAAGESTVGTQIDDTKLYWQIKSLFLNKDAQDLFAGVNVKVIEGRVILTGKVKNADASVDAVKLAWQPEGVREVVNEIQIIEEQSLGEIAKSKWIKAQVIAKITATKDVRSLNYSVEVVNGVVYLMGIAQDTDELNIVTDIASTVKGVEKVVSHVKVKNDPSRER
jgi:osmotically-inducible protein OsmY